MALFFLLPSICFANINFIDVGIERYPSTHKVSPALAKNLLTGNFSSRVAHLGTTTFNLSNSAEIFSFCEKFDSVVKKHNKIISVVLQYIKKKLGGALC
jgi:hypothetical protein